MGKGLLTINPQFSDRFLAAMGLLKHSEAAHLLFFQSGSAAPCNCTPRLLSRSCCLWILDGTGSALNSYTLWILWNTLSCLTCVWVSSCDYFVKCLYLHNSLQCTIVSLTSMQFLDKAHSVLHLKPLRCTTSWGICEYVWRMLSRYN